MIVPRYPPNEIPSISNIKPPMNPPIIPRIAFLNSPPFDFMILPANHPERAPSAIEIINVVLQLMWHLTYTKKAKNPIKY